MNVHQITLSGYTASAGTDANCVSGLYLGTAGSYGVEQLDVVQSAGWENLSVTAIFQPCGVKITVPAEGGPIDVPWEATADALPYPQGRIVFQGYADGELINTCDIVYTVSGHSATAGTDPQPPTPDQYQQFVKEVQASAKAAANSATEAAGSASAAAGSASAAAGSAQQAADTLQQVQEAGQQATEDIGTAQSDAIKAVGDAQSAAVQAVQGQQQTSVGAVQAAGTAAVDQVSQAGQQQVQAVKDEGTAQIGTVAEAGSAQVQAVQQAGAQQITDIDEAGAQQVQAVNSAGNTKLDQINTAIAHPPQPNTATGFWQVWNAEAGKYEDTTALYQGGYYTPSVAVDGTLTWTGSQAGMTELPSANIRGPAGLGVPTPSADAAGKVPTVNDTGDGYLLTGPYAPLEASIRPTANGNPAVCEDSIAWGFQGLKVYGKSTQDGAPSPENPVPIVSAGGEGEIDVTITGKNLLSSDLLEGNRGGGKAFISGGVAILPYTPNSANGGVCKTVQVEAGTTYTLSVTNPNANYSLFVSLYSSLEDATDYNNALQFVNGSASTRKLTITPEQSGVLVCLIAGSFIGGEQYIHMCTDTELLQLEIGSSATTYEPPKSSQSLTISTPNGLPGIPVESGGNYTDASGQQLVCDVVDYETQKYIQNCVKVVLDGSDDENWTVRSTSVTSEFRYGIKLTIPPAGVESSSLIAVAMCDKFLMVSANATYSAQQGASIDDNGKLMFFCDAVNTSNVTDWKNWLKENLVTLIYQIATPITTPLSAEEIAAYRALTTYSSTTVVSTAEPVAGIEARYILDGTAAWNKVTTALAQLSAANTQTSQVVNTMLGASE